MSWTKCILVNKIAKAQKSCQKLNAQKREKEIIYFSQFGKEKSD